MSKRNHGVVRSGARRNNLRDRKIGVLAAAVAGGLAVGHFTSAPASAATIYFQGFSNNWSDPTQWSSNTVPGSTAASTDAVEIDDGGQALVNVGDSFAPATIIVGNNASGQVGSGELTQSGGLLAPIGTSPTMIIGDNGGTGEYDLNGGSFNTGTSEFWVSQGAGSSGYFNMSAGTLNVGNWLAIGRGANTSTGIINISGGTISQQAATANNNHITLGSVGGNGTINQTGGTITSNSIIYLGETGPGVVNITAGNIVTPGIEFSVGTGGVGTLNLSGGTVTTAAITAGITAANQLNFNGGVLQAQAASTNWIALPSSEINVQGGGAIFDTNGFAVTISTTLSGTGGLTLQGGNGTLTLSSSNTYTGDTTINAGTLAVTNTAALSGTTNIRLNAGALAINSDADITGKNLIFTPGTSGVAGALQFANYNSSLSFDTGATPNLTLGASTGTASSLSGQIVGTGTLTFVGPGILNLTNTANTYSGGTNIDAGVLQIVPGSVGTGTIYLNGTGTLGIGSDAALATLPTPVFNGGGITFNNYASALNFSPGTLFTLGAAAGAASTLNGVISDNGANPTSVNYVGPGTLILAKANPYSGTSNISGGTLNFSSGGLGSGNVILQGGATLQYAPSNTTDLTSGGRTLTLGTGGGTLDLGANNVTFAGNIIDPSTTGGLSGAFTKLGTGTLTLQGSLNTTDVFVRMGTLVLTGTAGATTAYNPVTTNNDYSSIGQVAGDSGTLTLQNSAAFTEAGDLNIGDVSATGVLNISGTAVVTTRNLSVGKYGTSSGTVNQTGGTVQQANNGAGAGDWRIGGYGSGADAAAVGVYNLSGGTFNTSTNFQVGDYGTGTFTQTGGSATVGTGTNGSGGGYLSIGRYAGGTGVYDMSSGNGTLNASGAPDMLVGEQGTGTLKVGGTSAVTANILAIGFDTGSAGQVLQTGGTVTAPAGVTFGANGSTSSTAVFNLSGGVLTVGSVTQGASGGISGTFDFNGGTLTAATAAADLMTGVTTANVQIGGAIINTNGLTVSIAQALKHDTTSGAPLIDGGLTKIGTGTLQLATVADSYTGPTNISNGTLQLNASNLIPFSTATNTSNGVTIGATGTLNLNGFTQQVASLSGSAGASITLGSGTLALINPTGFNATFNGVISGTGSVTKSGVGIQTLGGADTYTGNTQVSQGTLNLGANPGTGIEVRTLGGLLVSAGAKLVVGNAANHANRTLLIVPYASPVTSTYNVSVASSIDLGSNDMDLVNAGTAGLTAINTAIKGGFKLGAWNGTTGILSSVAAANTSHLTALGVILNGTTYGTAAGSLGTFDTINPGANDVLVKYTYYGDANLDGAVDGSDYTKIDAGFKSNGTLTGWQNGDFNYDGKIDGSDYTLIDNAFNTQGATLGSNPAALIASSAAQFAGGSSAVPEPATLGLLAVGGLGLLSRRRRI